MCGYVWHGSLICVAMCGMAHWYVWHDCFPRPHSMCDKAWQDSFTCADDHECATWLIRDHECATWLIRGCAWNHDFQNVCRDWWHDSFRRFVFTTILALSCVLCIHTRTHTHTGFAYTAYIYMYIWIHMYMCIHIYICIYIYTQTHTHTHTHISSYTHMHIRTCILRTSTLIAPDAPKHTLHTHMTHTRDATSHLHPWLLRLNYTQDIYLHIYVYTYTYTYRYVHKWCTHM